MTRPRSVRLFEVLFLGSLLLTLIATALAWDGIVATAAARAGGGKLSSAALNLAAGLGAAVVTIATVVLWWLVACRASLVAKWLVVAFAAYNVYALVRSLQAEAPLTTTFGWLVLASTVAQVAAASLLFAPDARAWFKTDPKQVV